MRGSSRFQGGVKNFDFSYQDHNPNFLYCCTRIVKAGTSEVVGSIIAIIANLVIADIQVIVKVQVKAFDQNIPRSSEELSTFIATISVHFGSEGVT